MGGDQQPTGKVTMAALEIGDLNQKERLCRKILATPLAFLRDSSLSTTQTIFSHLMPVIGVCTFMICIIFVFPLQFRSKLHYRDVVSKFYLEGGFFHLCPQSRSGRRYRDTVCSWFLGRNNHKTVVFPTHSTVQTANLPQARGGGERV